jgi:hypothetical protein
MVTNIFAGKTLFVKYISGIPKSNSVFASQKYDNKRLIINTTVHRNQGNWTISYPGHRESGLVRLKTQSP